MEIKNWFLRSLTGVFVAAIAIACLIATVFGIHTFYVIIFKPIIGWLDIESFAPGLFIVFLFVIFIGIVIGRAFFKPEEKEPPVENKPARPNPDNYHPECWDEGDFGKQPKEY